MRKIVALSKDRHWLDAVQMAAAGLVSVQIIACDDLLLKCLSYLPPVDAQALLLVDAISKENISEVVAGLYQAGWRFIVVVAADPSVKEVYKVLKKSNGYDYWRKTYVVSEIEETIKKCLDDMTQARAGSGGGK